MIPIKPIKVIEKGIAVYVPTTDNFKSIKIEIFYFKTNPLFSWVLCDNTSVKLWESKSEQIKNGTLFIYNTNDNLKEGFYKISLKAYNNNGRFLEGSITIGLDKDKPTLIIGMPYSAYSPITLS